MRNMSRIAMTLMLSAAFLSCRSASASMPLRAPNPGPDSVQSGIALYEQGKYAEAEATLKDAQGVQANAYRAAALVKQKKYGEAEAAARAAFDADPANEMAVAVLGEALVNQKKYDEAIDLLGRAIQAKPSLAYAYFWRAQAHQGKKKTDRMIEDFDTFLKLAPKAPEAGVVRQTLNALR